MICKYQLTNSYVITCSTGLSGVIPSNVKDYNVHSPNHPVTGSGSATSYLNYCHAYSNSYGMAVENAVIQSMAYPCQYVASVNYTGRCNGTGRLITGNATYTALYNPWYAFTAAYDAAKYIAESSCP